MVTKQVEQHICIKFCQKLGHSCSEVGCAQDKEWFRQFIEGRMSVESDECSGRPPASRNQLMIDTVCCAMLDNRRITESSLKSWGSHLVWYSPF